MNESNFAKGRFIAIEGVDGAGKGVQSRRLRDELEGSGVNVLLTREPGGSPGAEEIRNLLVQGTADRWDAMTELLLIYAARRDHLAKTIKPALQQGRWVISDRFADSSRAFQGIAGGLGLDTVEAVHAQVVGDFAPDLTIVLDLDPEQSLARTVARGGNEDRFEKKGLEYQQQVRGAFLHLAQRSPRTHVLIDAGRSVDEVAHDVLRVVTERLGLAE
ncbi:MAG: dTMP kinase [Pseudomonadota bacterium]|nr:dTMP kinase [Pseudomonadota bacterium]